jgi:hypothetical protein
MRKHVAQVCVLLSWALHKKCTSLPCGPLRYLGVLCG